MSYSKLTHAGLCSKESLLAPYSHEHGRWAGFRCWALEAPATSLGSSCSGLLKADMFHSSSQSPPRSRHRCQQARKPRCLTYTVG